MELHHMYGKPEILAKEYVEHGKLIWIIIVLYSNKPYK